MVKLRKQTICISITNETFNKIESDRGRVNRSVYVGDILEEYYKK